MSPLEYLCHSVAWSALWFILGMIAGYLIALWRHK